MNTTERPPSSADSAASLPAQGLPDILRSSSALNRGSLSIKTTRTRRSIGVDTFDSICRICHGGTSVDNLLKPCRCKGSLALVHLNCLEKWLIESNRNYCELCNYTYRITRKPKYNYFWSIIMFFRCPEHNWKYMLADFIILIIYTPITITSTYMLTFLCDNLLDHHQQSYMVHFTIFAIVFGIAIINFTYASWLTITLDKYYKLWKGWYKKNCSLSIVLSNVNIPSN